MDEFKDLNVDPDDVSEAAEKVGEAAEEVKENVEETVSEAADAVEEVAEDAVADFEEAAEDAVADAEDTVTEIAENAEDTAEEITESIPEEKEELLQSFSTLTGTAPAAESSEAPAPKKKENKTLIALLIIGLAVIVCLVAVMLLLKKGDKNTGDALDTGADTTAVDTSAADSGVDPEVKAKVDAELEELKAKGISIGDFDYSKPFDDNGHWTDIKALDYVTLCDYKAIPVAKADVEVTDETVQQVIDQFLSQHVSSNQIKDRAVADGDTVNIDYVGSIDGVEFEGGNTGGAGTSVTIGVTSYIDDFLEQLIGHMPGDSFDVEVTFPEDYIDANEDAEKATLFNGKDAIFKTTINYIEEQVTPEFNDEFVVANLKEQYGWETADQARQEIRDDYYKSNMQTAINKYLLEKVTVKEIPEVMKNYQIESMFDYYNQGAQSYGVSLSELLIMGAGVSSVQDLLDQYNENIENNAKYDLIIQAIAEDAGIEFKEADLDKYLSDAFNIADRSEVEGTYGKNYLMYTCLNSSVVDMLIENAVVSD